jgi:hypothetical protein
LNVRAALNQLVRMLRERGELSARNYRKPTALDIVLNNFRIHLVENCGLAEKTINKRTYYVSVFLKETDVRRGSISSGPNSTIPLA